MSGTETLKLVDAPEVIGEIGHHLAHLRLTRKAVAEVRAKQLVERTPEIEVAGIIDVSDAVLILLSVRQAVNQQEAILRDLRNGAKS